MIEVAQTSSADPLGFEVTVREGAGESHHHVTIAQSTYARLCGGIAPEPFMGAVFRFLLDREPKEAILGRFDVSVVGRYFPDFENKLPDYLQGAG